ncbi:31166_t:CDS:2, partial [Racocetra persica]
FFIRLHLVLDIGFADDSGLSSSSGLTSGFAFSSSSTLYSPSAHSCLMGFSYQRSSRSSFWGGLGFGSCKCDKFLCALSDFSIQIKETFLAGEIWSSSISQIILRKSKRSSESQPPIPRKKRLKYGYSNKSGLGVLISQPQKNQRDYYYYNDINWAANHAEVECGRNRKKTLRELDDCILEQFTKKHGCGTSTGYKEQRDQKLQELDQLQKDIIRLASRSKQS